ncbi:MAG: efflux RND transporter periplasmic adaptor subunit [Gammaproteobacteria bacterium]|nr:efflux RND transporter periplasmic adaptor subunit [Gammaproteobacteria bacterium]
MARTANPQSSYIRWGFILLAIGVVGWIIWSRLTPAGNSFKPSKQVIVELHAVEIKKVTETVEAAAILLPNEIIDITARQDGRLTKVYFKEGSRVKKGDILVSLDTDAESAQLEAARVLMDRARVEAAQQKQLLDKGTISAMQYAQAQVQVTEAEKDFQDFNNQFLSSGLRAPFSGRVGLRLVSPGALIKSGSKITTLIDDSVWMVRTQVAGQDANQVRPGLKFQLKIPAIESTLSGTVVAIDSALDETTRTLGVLGKLDNIPAAIRADLHANQYAVVYLNTLTRAAMIVPEEALVANGEAKFVYVIENNKARMQRIEIGMRQPGIVEIRSGLKVGEMIAVAGLQKLRDGVDVTIATAESSSVAPVVPTAANSK